MATEQELKSVIEGMHIAGASALGAIRMLAELALHECDRGPGKLSGELIVKALEEISARADDAESCLDYEAEKLGLNNEARDKRRQSRIDALNGRASA